jgi:transposase
MASLLSLSDNTRYHLYPNHTDMRKGFDSLYGIVQNQMGLSGLSGDVFIFLNRRRTHIKLLVWEGNGLALYYKRLEKGTYKIPPASEQNKALIEVGQLQLILAGFNFKNIKKRMGFPHFQPPVCG